MTVALALAACAAPPPPVVPDPPPPVAPPPVRGAQPRQVDDAGNRCKSMVYRGVTGLTIDQAEYIADDIARALDGPGRAVGPALPAHCRLNGRIDARLDAGATSNSGESDASAAPAAAPIHFEMRLPTRWNGRYFHQGTDPLDSATPRAFGRGTGAGGLDHPALAAGFAVLASDAGRRGQVRAATPADRGDDADAPLARSATAAKAIVRTYYGKVPDRSYFVGCGEGGREGLVFAQRWPKVFDGIVAVAPRLRQTEAALAAAWTVQRLWRAAPRARGRAPVLSQALQPVDLFGAARAVLAQCDALDGAEDGFVMDLAGCRFDPAALPCSRRRGDAPDCLPPGAARALEEVMAGPSDAAGQRVYAPWPWDPGISAPGWRAWTLGSAGPGRPPDAGHLAWAAQVLARAGASPSEAAPMTFDFRRGLPRLDAARAAERKVVDTPLEAFRRRQGRLLLVHGAADPVVSAWATIDHWRRLTRAPVDPLAPGDAEFVRAFIVPGMNHCAGGPATDRFDALAAVVEWVEADRPPDRIEARGSAVLAGESRPLCPWPQVARYRGEGDVHTSASHACR